MDSTLIVNDPAIIGSEYITLVDLDGRPTAPTTRPAAESWPAWTDVVRYRLGASDEDLDRLRLSVGIGDALAGVVWRAEGTSPGFDGALEDLEACAGPLPVPADLREPHDWPDAPDAGAHCRFPGAATLAERNAAALADAGIAPIAGGSPEFIPSDEDLADYVAWSAELDRKYADEDLEAEVRAWYELHPVAEYNATCVD